MTCDECNRLIESFLKTILNYVAKVHYLLKLIEFENFPSQYEKERREERDLERALYRAMEELMNHRHKHHQDRKDFPNNN